MTMQENIRSKIQQRLNPMHLEVTNESHMHNVPEGSESHFKLTVVSDSFTGEKLIARHRLVNKILADELKTQIHALALHTLTPDEWFKKGGRVPASPECLGGSKS